MVSDIFELGSLAAPYGGLEYSVSWPRRIIGVGEMRWRLVEWAIRSGSFRVAFSDRAGRVLDVDTMLFYNWPGQDLVEQVLKDMPVIEAVAFESREHALKFIDSAEKYIMWTKLKQAEGN